MAETAFRSVTGFATAFLAACASFAGGVVEPVNAAIVQRPALDADGAWAMVDACRVYAKQKGWHVSIAVVDEGGSLLAFHRMDGSSLNSVQSAQSKARTSLLVRATTKDLATIVEKSDAPALKAAQQLAMGFYAAQGGLPVMVDGVAVAGVAAAGQSPDQDEECARVGMQAGLK